MLVKTEADKALDQARDHLQKTITALSKLVVEQVGGTDNYTDNFLVRARNAFSNLLDVRDNIALKSGSSGGLTE